MIVRVYFDQDLRYGLDGLTKLCQQKRIGLASMREGDMVMFINRARRQLKIMWGGRYLFTAYKLKGESRFTEQDLKKIAVYFRNDMFKSDMGARVKNYLGNGLTVVDDGEGIKVG